MKRILLLIFLTLALSAAHAQVWVHRPPLYIVNGVRMSEEQVKTIDPDDIIDNQLLPADEATIEKYGQEASNGVILITLRYDTPARFEQQGKVVRFSDFVGEKIKWTYPAMPVARVVIRLNISPAGEVSVAEVIDSTDKRFLKRVMAALKDVPRWVPALKDGKGVEDDYTLRLTLPQGMTPRQKMSVPIIVGGA